MPVSWAAWTLCRQTDPVRRRLNAERTVVVSRPVVSFWPLLFGVLWRCYRAEPRSPPGFSCLIVPSIPLFWSEVAASLALADGLRWLGGLSDTLWRLGGLSGALWRPLAAWRSLWRPLLLMWSLNGLWRPLAAWRPLCRSLALSGALWWAYTALCCGLSGGLASSIRHVFE